MSCDMLPCSSALGMFILNHASINGIPSQPTVSTHIMPFCMGNEEDRSS